ncbi:class I SAM-dependent methyltransferase [Aridibaculum aurantiacum]|uniref:class I SAM-dependent methyltransferase n=1 Tax=Aridibaculum aurantiacum TaxID=2810307 RepID=UPI001A964CCF|nr:class I SAM-dependent methyltransferase [Aridibaculum aurantiacum]
MDNYHETFETWNKVAKLYQDKFMDLDLYDETYDAFCEEVGIEHASILDVGCGPGNITKYLLNKRPGFTIQGIDISPNMVELAKANNPSASFTVMDCRDIGKNETQFGGIICGFCLPYLSATDAAKLLNDCSCLLKDGGVLYISFVEGDYAMSGFQIGSTGDRTYFYFHSISRLSEEITINNFEIVRSFDKTFKRSDASEEVHTILICRKKVSA